MPRSVFLGRHPGPADPLWLDSDRQFAMALLEVEADECSDCGHPVSESMAKESEGKYTATLLRCWACHAVATKAREHEKAGGTTAGLQITVVRDTPATSRA